MVARTIAFMEFELRNQGVTASLALSEQRPRVIADHIQIEQVLVNLCYNAMQAMSVLPVGQRKLRVETSVSGSDMAQIGVIDSGPGIAPENLARLFEPFFTTKSQGLGMGLNISRSIVENHGGRLTASPNPPSGMRFDFTLPLQTG